MEDTKALDPNKLVAMLAVKKEPEEEKNPQILAALKRSSLIPLEKLSKKVVQTLYQAADIGQVNVMGETHDVKTEMSTLLEAILKNILSSENAPPPLSLERKLRVFRFSMQALCQAARMNYAATTLNSLKNVLSIQPSKQGALIMMYKQKYAKLAQETLTVAYFSVSQGMFVADSDSPVGSSPSNANNSQNVIYLINNYLSLPAIRTLRELIGMSGMEIICQQILVVAQEATATAVAEIKKVLTGPVNHYDGGNCLFNAVPTIKSLCSLGAILKLRQLLLNSKSPIDQQIIASMKASGTEMLDNPVVGQIMGSLFGSPYWAEGFQYDVVHDALKDNSHLMGIAIDALLSPSGIVKMKSFYKEMVKAAVKAISVATETYKDNKKVDYPAMKMLIVVDQMIKFSDAADYSHIEPYTSYQFLRQLYANQFNSFIKKMPRLPQSD